MITPRRLQHIRNQFRRDRCSGLVLFILARVGEVGNDGCDAPCGRGLAGVDHDEEFHEAVVDVAGGGGLENEDCGCSSALCFLDSLSYIFALSASL